MSGSPRGHRANRRVPLTRERVIRAAVSVADRAGVAAVSMRRVADELGVEAMSLYHHVAGKEALLDGLVDAVFAEITVPEPGTPWRQAMRDRAMSAREVLARHPWALGLVESRRNPGAITLRQHDRAVGCLRGGGFSVAMAAHALAVLDSYVFGFVLQEANLPFSTPEEVAEVAAGMTSALSSGDYPHLVELMTEHALQPGYSFADEFDAGLALILDGLQRMVDAPG